MRTLDFIVVGILCLIGAAMPVNGAEKIGKDFPYVIFNDSGVVRYCVDPGKGAKYAQCWSNGVSSKCIYLPSEEGYLGACKLNEVIN